MTDVVNVPKLRFGEFDKEWVSYSIGDVSSCVTSGSRDWAKYYSSQGSKFVRMTNLAKEGITLLLEDMKYVSIPKSGSEGQRTSLIENDILISITAELGKIGIIPKDFGEAYINQHTALVRAQEDIINALFLAHSLATKKSNKKFNRLNDSGAKAGLNLSSIRGFNFLMPENEQGRKEQKKIATFLSKVDEKISLLTEKKAKLTEYKKGVMQQLFNGKWVTDDASDTAHTSDAPLKFVPPTLRFKADDGGAFPDWEEKRLGDVFDYKNGGSFENLVTDDGLFNLVTLNSIDINGCLKNKHKKVAESDGSLKAGDLIMVLSDVAHGNFLGLTDIIPDNSFVLNQRMGALKAKVAIVHQFARSFINHNQKYFKLMGQGSSQQNLAKGDILKFHFLFPCYEEQAKISEFLITIDKKINLANTELEKAKTWKQGLLQQMFV